MTGPEEEPAPEETAPAPPPTRHRWRVAIAVLAAAAVLVVVGGALWVQAESGASGKPGPRVIVTVAAGSGTGQLADTLAAKGVISSALAYRIWTVIHTQPELVPGTYAFDKNLSFAAADQIMAGGPNVFALVIPPGFTVREVGERVGQLPGHHQSAFDALATGGTVRSPWQPAGLDNLDGLLGTGTYIVVPGETDRQLLTLMVDRFDKEADAVGLASRSAALGLTPYQAVTAASIVEKEGVIAKNLGPVARVILNRLHAGMPLQMDSTVLYAEGRDGGTVTPTDLKLQTPYNTYLNTGLTPTPICFPSAAALEATLDPPSGSWLYFVVVDQDGTEAFADTYSQQLANETVAKQRGLP